MVAIGILPFKLFVVLSAKVTVIVKVSSKRYVGNMQNYCRSNCQMVLCQYLVQPKMKISPLHQLANDLECLQRALYNRSNSSGERKLQWLCVLTVL